MQETAVLTNINYSIKSETTRLEKQGILTTVCVREDQKHQTWFAVKLMKALAFFFFCYFQEMVVTLGECIHGYLAQPEPSTGMLLSPTLCQKSEGSNADHQVSDRPWQVNLIILRALAELLSLITSPVNI